MNSGKLRFPMCVFYLFNPNHGDIRTENNSTLDEKAPKLV